MEIVKNFHLDFFYIINKIKLSTSFRWNVVIFIKWKSKRKSADKNLNACSALRDSFDQHKQTQWSRYQVEFLHLEKSGVTSDWKHFLVGRMAGMRRWDRPSSARKWC